MKIIEWSLPEFKSIQRASNSLQQLHEFGFTHILLLPFFESGESPYCIHSHQNINPKLGSWNDMESFCKKARNYNMDVGVDVVLNHVSPQHPLTPFSFQKPPENTNWSDVWQINHQEVHVENYLLNHLAALENIGVHFIRVDAAFHIPFSFLQLIKKRFNFSIILDDYVQIEKLALANYKLNHKFRQYLLEKQSYPKETLEENDIVYFSNHDTIELASPYLEFMHYEHWLECVIQSNQHLLSSHYEHLSSMATYSFRKG
jgi:glycosidase